MNEGKPCIEYQCHNCIAEEWNICSVLKNLFDSFDVNDAGVIHINQLPGLLVKIGKDGGVTLYGSFFAVYYIPRNKTHTLHIFRGSGADHRGGFKNRRGKPAADKF